MKNHELKLDIKYFDDVKSGKKNFEIRKNDRDYQVGDILELRKISWLEKFLVLIRFAIAVMVGKRQTYLDINGNPCVKSKADIVKAKVNYVINYFETFNNALPRYNVVDYEGKNRSLVDVPEFPKVPEDEIKKVLIDYFHTNTLPDGYVVLGIEVTE